MTEALSRWEDEPTAEEWNLRVAEENACVVTLLATTLLVWRFETLMLGSATDAWMLPFRLSGSALSRC
jgi:hypothetical protein